MSSKPRLASARFRIWPKRVTATLNFNAYAASIWAVSLLLIACAVCILWAMGIGLVHISLLVVLGALSAADAAVALVNRIVTLFVRAVPLPGLALLDGVPASLRTMVVMPTMLTKQAEIAEHVERLEIHHLASPGGDLHFALLSDWTDADAQSVEGDSALLDFAREGVTRLNARYGPAPAGPRFLLLHRGRVYSDTERRWIGWERKRGKLHELNRWLRSSAETTYLPFIGADAPPPDVKYVLTLDSDTRLPRDAVRRLIGKIAHPLNRARFDPARGAVVEGYGVLQPRVTPSLPEGGRGFAVSADIFLFQRHRSVFLSRLRRLSGHVRRGLLRRQGDLRRRRVRDGARRPRSRFGPAEPRPVRGHVRPYGVRLRCRSGGRVSVALRREHLSSSALGARRLAVAALDPRDRAGRRGPRPGGAKRCRASGAGK